LLELLQVDKKLLYAVTMVGMIGIYQLIYPKNLILMGIYFLA